MEFIIFPFAFVDLASREVADAGASHLVLVESAFPAHAVDKGDRAGTVTETVHKGSLVCEVNNLARFG